MMSSRSILRNVVFIGFWCTALVARADDNGAVADRLEEEVDTAQPRATEPGAADGSASASENGDEAPRDASPALPAAQVPAPMNPAAGQAKSEAAGAPFSPVENATAAEGTSGAAAPAPEPVSSPANSVRTEDASPAAPSASPTKAPDENTASPKQEAEASAEISGLMPGQPVHYFLSYALDWTYVAASAGLRLSGVWDGIRPPSTWLGPNFTEDENSLRTLQEPRLFGSYNQPMLQEKVPASALAVAGAVAVAVATGVDGAVTEDPHRAHVLALGAVVAALFTMDATEALKLGVGRLRPDFAERYQRAACQGLVTAPTGLDCAPLNDGFSLDDKAYLDGFKSFPSGHASTSFALATYLSLWLHRTWVFGKRANAFTQPLAVLVSGILYSGAAFTAASRVTDHRHHLEDVAVGAALGTGIGAATWLLYFDADGEARHRNWSLTPQTYRDGGGIALAGSF